MHAVSCVVCRFADIKGFTAMSEQLHSSQVMLFLNRLYSVWDSLLDAFGVYKVSHSTPQYATVRHNTTQYNTV